MRVQVLILVFGLWLLPSPLRAATFAVTTTSDSGAGSLRQAILNANAVSDLDTIQFSLPGAPPFTISPTSPLPPLSSPVIIDATTQLGYAGTPIVELNGTSAGGSTVGLQVTGGGCTLRGLVINRFRDGIRLESANNIVQGNYIGTDLTGAIARGNGQYGVFLLGSSTNVIGGTTAANRNVISANGDTGIYIFGGTANVVQGNYIGLNATGTADLGNVNNGITLYDAPRNTLGGTAPGTRNVVAGNDGSGINLNTPATTGNVIQGNYLGVNPAGTAALGNTADGITLNDAPGNLIGGTNAGAGNLISGNGKSGIFLNGAGTRDNLIAGNLIGTAASGAAALANSLAGVTLLSAISNRIGDGLIEARNVISGNGLEGIFLTNSVGNRVRGNFVGTAANGTNALGNGTSGVALNRAAANSIGGPAAGERNIISGNTKMGVWILGDNATNNAIQGNFIGTDLSGQTPVPNALSGVQVEAPANQIGGGAPGAGNLISGNGRLGVWLLNSNAVGNFVRGNLIGTVAGGMNGLGNAVCGLGLTDAADNQIGGWTVAERNVISANGLPGNQGGIFVLGDKANGNRFCGNFIGTDITGQTALANFYEGIYLSGANSNIIGSELAGGGNLISGNGTRGIFFENTSWNVVQGNFIGMAADGETGLSNGYSFPTLSGFSIIDLTSSSNNLIGGTNPGAGNRIGYAPVLLGTYYAGVRVRDGSVNNAVLGNAIFSNGGLGIDVSTYGLTDNDAFAACDSDMGGNLRQNFPVLLDALSGNTTRVRGYLQSASGQTYRLQFFSNPTCDSSPLVSGYGEGKTFLGESTVVLGGVCSNSFTAFLTGGVPAGQVITATATGPANNTSEFSPCLAVTSMPQLSLSLTGSTQVSLAWTNTAPGSVLKVTSSLTPPIVWTTVTNVPVLQAGQFTVTLTPQTGNWFYRLSFE